MATYKTFMGFSRKFEAGPVGPTPDVEAAFLRFSGGGPHMTPDQLLRFLIESQGEVGTTIEDADRIIERLHVDPTKRELTVEDFHRFLFSDEINPPIPTQVHHDMSAPLSHYYIFTGHNSYLTGNQLSSDCSDIPIIKALQSGVRVIELDIWPNSDEDDVDVLHGRTMTSPVALIKCLKSIREHAFSASSYPVVITLEDHLTPDLQAKVAEMLTQTFGDMLFCPESKNMKELPSPESLKNRVLISTKPPKEYLKSKNLKDKTSDSGKGKVMPKDEPWEKKDDEDSSENKDPSEDDDPSEEDDEEDEKLNENTARQYKNLIAIRAGKPKGGLEEALKIDVNKVRRLSLSEPKLEKVADTCGTNIVRFTEKNILRVYPKGTRFDSSNYNPLIGWVHGAQMVAFNMQGYGKSLWLMHGLFRGNGGCGYFKKPDFLIKPNPSNVVFDPQASLPVKRTLKVKVYMGGGWSSDFSKTHFDKFSPPDFYARVGVAGLPADCIMKKTKTIDDNWTPIWNEEFEFPLTVPELALLRIEVMDDDTSQEDDFGGQTCLPVSELRPGIRAVPLFDKKGRKYKSVKLLMCFQFN